MSELASNEIVLQVSAKRGRGRFLETILESGNEWIELATLGVNSGLTGSFIGSELASQANRINDAAKSRLGGINPFEFSVHQEGMDAGMIRINPQVKISKEGEGSRNDFVFYRFTRKKEQ